jgi:membrane associated rhomboid family serine protease
VFFGFALVPARLFGAAPAGFPPAMVADGLTLLTNTFLHAGWLHLLLNMWTFWIFGPAVEDRFGARRFLAFYLLCGVAASAGHAVANSASLVPALGASGAIASVIGCYVRLFPFARLVMVIPILILPFFFEIPAFLFAAIWFAMQVFPGLVTLAHPGDAGGIAWWAHIAGFVVGWLMAPIVRRPPGRHRRFFRDEGVHGFLPDGRRGGGVR